VSECRFRVAEGEPDIDIRGAQTFVEWGLSKVGLRAFRGGPPKNPVLGHFYFLKFLTPKLVSKVLY
jgi:hypothetical protein